MLQRWKLILSNWINCYFNNSEDEEQNLNIEALITIISHLRQNLNLDESKSSLLEAHTVEEFICEKYPQFKFENGTIQASNEEEVCLAASLLLFFVCVNSKNLDIKNAMCSKLRADDQDIIIKFSKCLLDCPVITVGEVQAAITEACGQDIAAMELPRRYMVAETPPAMRSMHSNIRRLQAELEAERFDRNYLQDELARTNSRLEKLLKEKEQHKLEILSLKGKISLCCGDEGSTRSSEGVSEESSKLARQLQQLESKLEETLTQLHDVQYERDTLKQKMDHLKTDRDKWLTLVQQENARVSQLSNELETERRHNQSLKDLVAELRQHNRLNGLDTSSLECDDPDASIHSLQHNNSSICSEACANVVEVQLGEERAKIVVLKQQIQTLHAQISQLNEIRETEKASLQNAVAQRDNDICDLKHRINEEIEKKNNMKAHCDNEITKLNNEINELEQKLKESHEHSRAAIEQKMGEIQTLQEEKLSLIQSLNNETTKLENVIQELQHDLDSEKQSRSKMKESYENHVMKLNEKVLNRNNELVELQNSIFIKAEEIETLQIDIRNEKEAFAKLMTQYESLDGQKNTLQNELRKEKDTLQKVTHEKDSLVKQKTSLEIEIEKEKKAFGELINKYQIVNEEKDAVEKERAREQEIIKELNKKYEDIEKDHKLMESDLKKVKEAGKKLQNKYHTLHEHHKELKAEHCKDKEIFAELKNKHQDLEKIHEQKQTELVQKTNDQEVLKHKYDETVKQINALKNNLEKEKDVVKEYKAKHHSLEKENTVLQTNIRELKESHETLTKEYKDVINQRNNVQDEVKKEKESFKELLQNYQNLVEHKNMIENDLKLKCDEGEHLKSDLEAKVLSMKDKLTESEELAEKLKTSYECQIENLNVMVTKLTNYMKEKTSKLEILRADKDLLQQSIVDHCRVIDHLQGELTTEKQNIEKMTSDFESERQVLKNMVTVTESVMEDTKLALNNEISDLTKVKLALEAEKADLEASVTDLRRKYEGLETANTSLLALLQIEKKGKDDVEKESEIVREYLDQVMRDLEQERKTNASVIQTLESQKQTLIEENVVLKKDLEDLQTVNAQLESKANAFEDEIKSLKDEKCQLDEKCQHTAKMLAEAQSEINKQKEKLESLIDENSNLKQTEEIICDEKEKYKSEINNLKTEAQSQEEKIKALLEEKSQAKVDIQNLKDRLQDTLKEKSELESDLEEKSHNITKVQQEIKQLQSKILILTDDNNLLKFRENESSSKIRELENSMKVLETGFRSQLEFESNDKTIFMDKFRKLEDELEKVSEEKMLLENEIQEKTEILKAVQLKNDELESKVAILTDENNNLMLEKNESLTKLGEYNAKEFDLRNDLELAQYANNNLTIAIRAVETELNTKDEELAKLSEEKEDLEVAFKDKEDSVTLVQAELKDMQVKLAEYTCMVDSLKQDKEDACMKIQELSVELEAIEQIKTVNTDLKTTIVDLENNLQSKENDLQTALQEKLELGNNLQTHIMKLAEATEKKTEVETSLQKTVQNLNVVKTELKELNNQIAVLLNERDKSEIEKQESSAKIEKINAKIKDLKAVQNDNQELSTKVTLLEKELQTTSDNLQTVIQEKSKLEADIQNRTDQLQKVTEEKKKTEKGLEEKTAQEISHTAMITKLTNYLKEKTTELEALRKDKEILQQTVGDSCKVIKTLEETITSEKQNIDKLTSGFESARQVLKNMVSATESVMEDTKLCLNNEISLHLIEKECLQVEKEDLQASLKDLQNKHQDLELASVSLLSLLKLAREGKQDVEKESENVREYLDEVISYLGRERNTNISVISALEFQEKAMAGDYEKMKSDFEMIQKTNNEMKIAMKDIEKELHTKEDELHKILQDKAQVENQLHVVLESKSQLEQVINEKTQNLNVFQIEIRELKNKMEELFNVKNTLELEKRESQAKLEEFRTIVDSNETKEKEELAKLKSENKQLLTTIEENKTVITNLEQLIKHELEENHKLRDDFEQEKMVLSNKCCILQDYQTKAEKVLEDRQKEIDSLQKEVQTLQNKADITEQDCKAKDGLISKMSKEKDAVISTISKELVEEKALREKLEKELQSQKTVVNELRNNIEIRALKKENEQLIRAIGQQETLAALSQDKAADRYPSLPEPHQVDSTTSDYTHSSVESLKTITDLEKIIHDKNRTITTLQTDITYLKTLMAESETKLMDVTKELELSKDNVQQLSNQLKKIVYQKNEEIVELKKQVNKMSATETRASQIIKVSAKYQAMILKRIAEIKSNTVLKELQNLGNSENELRRSLNAGSVTMEDLENFLDTTDRHLKRCAEKQIAMQKERDRLTEINRINESEIINLKKFLTELSVSFQTFSSMKDLYAQKLSRVVSVQRTVRREILSLDGRISDASMCKLERGYGATMQDLAECTMNLERWVEKCISRTVSAEKIKQAFTSDTERSSLSTPSFQNTGLEIQLEELEKSFQKLLEDIARAVKNEGAVESQASTVMEVRAEYEDKLNRMKAKMKDLFNEQMTILKNKQREEIELLERELQKTRTRMEDSKRAYEAHIKELTKELWNVGEKYLVKRDEADWLQRKQKSGSLMSLQHVHSSGLMSHHELPSRPSDAHSLRSLPVADNHPKPKREARGLHMSDEEGEVFDNRCLKELAMTPRREPTGQRLSELKWRNSFCPPHLKSSYPAETQFAATLDEDDLKAGMAAAGARAQRKEVGITAYKKPGPPTPSKQAGRLSATDSELRESLRVESEPLGHAERKTSTPARFRALFQRNKHDNSDGTPRARRLSNIFRKKQ